MTYTGSNILRMLSVACNDVYKVIVNDQIGARIQWSVFWSAILGQTNETSGQTLH